MVSSIENLLLSPVEVVIDWVRAETTTLTAAAEQRQLSGDLSPIFLCEICALEGRIDGCSIKLLKLEFVHTGFCGVG
jgi:hypothetical protein